MYINHNHSFGALIWNVTRTNNDIKYCREAKVMIIGVDISLNSLNLFLVTRTKDLFFILSFMTF